ncbi:MAG: DUF5615 family PIN-like protein [Armatimonadetes bacterium]|nr:DUF5615 family PIN-like protein [Armatimonadota bacterium]
MRLLLDQNLPARLARALTDLYPGSLHVWDVGLQSATDQAVWDYARGEGLVIVSKDSDFRQHSFLFGFPPKVVWIRLGNCSTKEIEQVLRDRYTDIEQFCTDPTASFLVLP